MMSFTQVLYVVFLMVGATFAKGYGVGSYGGGYGPDSHGYAGGQEKFAPKPYDFGYVADGYDGSHYRSEKGDSSGNVQGSYGYTDKQGLHRKVEYIANAGGFRASVKTNEPGTDGKEDPADVQMHVQPPPPGIQEKYSVGSASPGFGGAGLGKGYGPEGVSQFGGAGLGKGYGPEGVSQFGATGLGKGYGPGGVPQFGGAGLFAGIPRSSSGKSIY